MTGTASNPYRYSQVLDTALPDGSFVVGSSYDQGKSLIVHLRRVLPDCRIAAFLGAILPGKYGINVIAGTPDGRVLLGGDAGHSALVGRFFADGGLDRSFGTDGWTRLKPHEKPVYRMPQFFNVTSITFAPSGRIVVGGTDGGAHCCVRSFVSELTPDGSPIATFGRNSSMVVPHYAGSYTADVSPNPDGSVYVLDQYQGSGCGGPSIVRMFTDGSLDRHFDKTIGRTIKGISGRHMLFSPSLVPDGQGGFTLVGDFDRTCRIFRHWRTSGVAVRIGPSGRVASGLTHFPSPRFSFYRPAAIRLPSGRILAAGAGVTSTLVQVFGPDGSRDPSVGDHGLLRIGLPSGVRGHGVSGDLLRAADGSAWLVRGFPHEIDLTPLPVR